MRNAMWKGSLLLLALGAATAASAMGAGEPPAAEPQATPESGTATLTITDEQGNVSQVDLAAAAAAFANRSSRSSRSGNLRPWKQVSDGFEEVVSTTDGGSLYSVWVNDETQDMLAELPRGFARQKHYIATTVAGGEIFAGLQAADYYVQWKRYGKDRLALILPQLRVRSSGDQESKDSVDMIFTDRVLIDVPILSTGPNGQPVIDLDSLLVNNATTFFGFRAAGLNTRLKEVASAKAFPENIEIAYKLPDRAGTFKTLHYSISRIQGTPGYKPREADERLGYFVTGYEDYGQFERSDVYKRYINRWNLEKADRRLDLSPPKEPIVFYVEHTTPVRYRRAVRDGIEYWNRAFRNIGIDGAIEVRFQDRASGAHMDKDPEDVRYNFIRWLSNDIATAIGPSRVDPNTGEILDADVVLTDGWVRVFTYRWEDLLPELAIEGFGPETLEWLEANPDWDPRVRMAAPSERERVIGQIQRRRGVTAYGGDAISTVDPTLLGDDEYDGLIGRVSQTNGMCRAAHGMAMNLAMARMRLESLGPARDLVGYLYNLDYSQPEIPEERLKEIVEAIKNNPDFINFVPPNIRDRIEAMMNEEQPEEEEEETDEGEEPKAEKPKRKKNTKGVTRGDLIDGVPEWFVNPALAELVAHEVGHTLGLRHNFKASAAYTLAEINSEDFKGKKPWSASVMDYNGVNIFMPTEDGSAGTVQGDFSSIDIGPYDMWVIEYGYTFGDTDKVLERVNEPELAYGTDEDANGTDPTVRRYDLSADPLDWSRNQMRLAQSIRENLLDGFVEDGESWARARRGYEISLNTHFGSVAVQANWIGGAYYRRDKKGDPGGRAPIEPVEVEKQRAALDFVIDNTFYDKSFGLTPELLRYMSVDKWFDRGGQPRTDALYSVHDRILGIQASAMTALLNPTTLRRVYDNEFAIPEDEDALTLAELMGRVTWSAWDELQNPPRGEFTNRSPMISSLRRNLQREHLERLIDLTLPGTLRGASVNPIRNLATMHLRELHGLIGEVKEGARGVDDYTLAHLGEAHTRIAQALDAKYIYNTDKIGGGGQPQIIFIGQDGKPIER
ncbi:MAG: zinc-dependent metalloprotease [Planctomycetota bacterium]